MGKKLVITDGSDIENCAYMAQMDIEEVEITGNVERIGAFAFATCASLRSVKLPETVNEIEKGAFADCVALEQINIPNNVRRIGFGAFKKCFSLESLSIPADTVLGERVFEHCQGLTVEFR